MNKAFSLILATLLSCVGLHANAGLFSLEIVQPASELGDIGTLQILYHGGEENLSFAVGGLDLKLSSSTAGVIKFLDAEVINNDERWDIAVARQTTDNEVGELFAASIFSPGLASGGPQVFAEVKYSLVESGFTDLILDVGGEDPVYQGDRGDVSSYVRSRGICVGDCDPNSVPTEINLGDSWAVLREQLYAPPVIPAPQPTPVVPPSQDPIASEPPAIPPTWELDPIVSEPIDNPPVDTPDDEVDLPDEVPSVIEVGFTLPTYRLIDLVEWSNWGLNIDTMRLPVMHSIDVITDFTSSPLILAGSTNLFTRNGQLRLYDGDIVSLGYTMAFDASPSSLGSAVPEPHSLLLVASASLGFRRGRRRQSA